MNDAKAWYKENEENYDLYNDPDEMVIDAFEAGQKQYKSIVKKVDADNLPDGEVLALSKGEFFLIGYLINDEGDIWCECETESMIGCTHYIEKKDLINLFNGASK